ncbi:hypothetical protein JTE90_026162 [Oedothorax gibbosus]|uniref:Uncharacterized protein n=1 Tax=Oedothorax gibbosus TaxID=931172 RepID=A0AAV6UFV9_9ARAC|nr:hypothetical protein JTE90_026162 [Oedothorax gibbosus]
MNLMPVGAKDTSELPCQHRHGTLTSPDSFQEYAIIIALGVNLPIPVVVHISVHSKSYNNRTQHAKQTVHSVRVRPENFIFFLLRHLSEVSVKKDRDPMNLQPGGAEDTTASPTITVHSTPNRPYIRFVYVLKTSSSSFCVICLTKPGPLSEVSAQKDRDLVNLRPDGAEDTGGPVSTDMDLDRLFG